MMKQLGGKLRRALVLMVAAATAWTMTPAAHAQAAAAAALHGHTNDPGGIAFKSGEVKLSTDRTSAEKDRKYEFTFEVDGNGDYKGTGIKPGEYIAFLVRDGKTADYQTVVLKAGDDKTLNFDLTREEYLKSLSPEARAALEEAKKKNAGVLAENAKIADINKTLVQARADIKAGKADDAVTAMQSLTQARPTEPVLWATLGEAQLASADAAAKAARAAKTNPQDPAILQKYADAAASYQKAVDLNATAKKPSPETVSASYLNMGQAYAKSGKTAEAQAAYENSVKALPSSAGAAYFNEAAILFNAGKNDEAAAAADKAIAADPKRADSYYIKGQSLITKASVDSKTNKIVAPPGCVEAYQEYLELDPNGAHANDVKELLAGLGQPIKNSFKAGRK